MYEENHLSLPCSVQGPEIIWLNYLFIWAKSGLQPEKMLGHFFPAVLRPASRLHEINWRGSYCVG